MRNATITAILVAVSLSLSLAEPRGRADSDPLFREIQELAWYVDDLVNSDRPYLISTILAEDCTSKSSISPITDCGTMYQIEFEDLLRICPGCQFTLRHEVREVAPMGEDEAWAWTRATMRRRDTNAVLRRYEAFNRYRRESGQWKMMRNLLMHEA